MAHLNFGAFLAPHHPIGEHPMLQYQRDLDFVEHLDKLGFNEFWCGEHHSTGWETIASPEMFLAAAGQRSHRINLGTGVVSLPYHHPFNVAQRMVQLDHMTGGRAIFGSGPGALPSDAYTLGIDPMTQRDRQDEAIGVIRRLLAGEDRFDYECEWFTMKDAKLQLLPLQEELPFAVASMPPGNTCRRRKNLHNDRWTRPMSGKLPLDWNCDWVEFTRQSGKPRRRKSSCASPVGC